MEGAECRPEGRGTYVDVPDNSFMLAEVQKEAAAMSHATSCLKSQLASMRPFINVVAWNKRYER